MVAPEGACVVAPGGHAWLLGGCAWLLPGGMHGCSGVCVVAPGGHAWLLWGGGCAWDMTRYRDTVNEQAVRILLECILVLKSEWINFHETPVNFSLSFLDNNKLTGIL